MLKKNNARRLKHLVEQLEQRRLLSASLERLDADGRPVEPLDPPAVVEGTPTLAIVGFAGADTIFVSVSGGNISYTINGVAFSDDDSLYSQINVNGLGGGDTITLASTGDNVVNLVGDSGNDTITVGGPGTDLGLISSNVFVFGGFDTDTVIFDDSAFTGSSGYTLNSTQFVVPSVAPIIYTETEAVILNCGSGNDSVDAESSSVPVTINAGSGSDAIRLSPTLQNLQNLAANVSVNGGIGNDTLTMNDQADPLDGAYQFFGAVIQRNSGVSSFTNYSTVESLVFNGSGNEDVFQMDTVLAGHSATLNGGAGDDLINVGFGPGTMANIQGPLTLAGGTNTGGGSDAVEFYDDLINEDRNYIISNGLFQSTGRANISLNTFELGRFDATTGSNIINIDLSTAGATFTLNALAGDDTVNATISNPGAQTPGLTVNGGIDGMGDSIFLTDPTNTFDDRWTIEPTRVSRTFFAGLTYNGVEQVSTLCGPGANRIDITGTALGTGYFIDGGGAADDFRVINTNSGFVNLVGGAGDDAVTIESNAAAFFQNPELLGAVTVNGTGGLLLGGTGAFGLRALSVSSTADVDIRSATLVVNYTGVSPQSDVVTDIVNGSLRSAETLSVAGTAVGYAEMTDLFVALPPTLFGVAVDATTLVIRHTYRGDADLNRTVNLDDFTRLAANFGLTPRAWAHGNFNFDAGVNLDDFTALAANFGNTLASDARRATAAEVVEDRWISKQRVFTEVEI
jgi:hypothetical protein